METKLLQKHIFKGTQEFEIVDDVVNVRMKPRLRKEETLTVMLTVLNPEPLINKSLLEFTSRVNNEPLLSLFIAKPNTEEFNQFVNILKQRIQEEYNAFAGIKPGKTYATGALEGNVFEEPPEFDDPEFGVHGLGQPRKQKPVRIDDLEDSIRMLNEYIGTNEIQPLITALEALKEEPDNSSHRTKVVTAFNGLGQGEGAVLTYAPYVGILMTDGPATGY